LIPTLIFDLETIPDIKSIRRLYNLDETLSDFDVVNIANFKRRQKVGHDFLPVHLHQVVAISCVLKTDDRLEVWTLGNEETDEAGILKHFFEGLDKYSPNLVSWNGSGFDLPVLNYRMLANKISSEGIPHAVLIFFHLAFSNPSILYSPLPPIIPSFLFFII